MLSTTRKAGLFGGKRFMSHISSPSATRPLVAIVGAGPSGFYAACGVRRNLPEANIDIFEKLPFPYGLIRYGVAPDHPEVKNCISQFEKFVIQSDDKFQFFGNVNVGKDIRIEELFDAYDAVILAYGAEGEKQLHVDELQPGAKNFFSARSFVGWYNGLPNSSNLPVDLSRVETAAIFGHGNVALDIARILLSSPDKLAKTDISAKSLDMLRRSSVKKVYLIGRRGPLQVSFTIKELREMINLKNSFTTHITSEFFQLLKEPEIIEKISRPRRRLTQLMMEVAIGTRAGDARNQLKQFHIKFLRSPVKILITESGQINGVQVEINDLLPTFSKDNLSEFERGAKAVSTGLEETIKCEMIISSIGFQGNNIDSSGLLPFDSHDYRIRTDPAGKILGISNGFASGWCAHGPTGVLATTSADAIKVAKSVVNALSNASEKGIRKGGAKEIRKILSCRHVDWISWTDWLRIDETERSRGAVIGKPREKIVDLHEAFDIIQRKKN